MTEAELQKIQIMWNGIMNMENVCIQTVSWMILGSLCGRCA